MTLHPPLSSYLRIYSLHSQTAPKASDPDASPTILLHPPSHCVLHIPSHTHHTTHIPRKLLLLGLPVTCELHVESLQSCPTLCDPMDCYQPGSSVHGILQARISSRLLCCPPESLPNPGIKPTSLMSPALAGRFFITSATWEALCLQWEETVTLSYQVGGSIKIYFSFPQTFYLVPLSTRGRRDSKFICLICILPPFC